jgi:hypothetical protein
MAAVPPLPLPDAPRSLAARAIALVRDTWARRSWYFAGAVAAYCIVAPFVSAGYVALLLSPMHIGHAPGQLLADVVNATVLMLFLSLADTAVEEGARMRRTYAVALIAGSLVASLVQWHMLEAFDIDTFLRRLNMPVESRRVQMAFVAVSNLMVGGLLLWVHVQWRETRRSAQALHQGEHDRLALAQQAETARLLALQSRIEPQWLVDVMGRVRVMWRRDPRAGAALLDDIIVTLRHAMPPRTMQSTLARECALLDGQLRLRAVLQPGAALGLQVEVPPELANARLAPLVLWPLVQWLLESQRAPTAWMLSAHEYRSAAGKPRLALRLHSADARWPSGEGVLGVLRTRLAAVHGASAELKAVADTEGVALRLDVALRQVDNRDAECTDR